MLHATNVWVSPSTHTITVTSRSLRLFPVCMQVPCTRPIRVNHWLFGILFDATVPNSHLVYVYQHATSHPVVLSMPQHQHLHYVYGSTAVPPFMMPMPTYQCWFWSINATHEDTTVPTSLLANRWSTPLKTKILRRTGVNVSGETINNFASGSQRILCGPDPLKRSSDNLLCWAIAEPNLWLLPLLLLTCRSIP